MGGLGGARCAAAIADLLYYFPHQLVLRTKAASKAAVVEQSSLVIVRCISGGVFHIASDIVRRALRLIQLSFRLHLRIARHLSDGIFYSALSLLGGTFGVFAVHCWAPKAVANKMETLGVKPGSYTWVHFLRCNSRSHLAIMMFFLLACYLAIIAGLFGVVGAKIVSFVALLGAFGDGAILAVYLLSAGRELGHRVPLK
jgi:hypothetical protein